MTEIEELKIYIQACNEKIFNLELKIKELTERNQRQTEMLKEYDETLGRLKNELRQKTSI